MTDQIDIQLIDQLLKNYKSPDEVLGEKGLLRVYPINRADSKGMTYIVKALFADLCGFQG
jgi:hypothetical protein